MNRTNGTASPMADAEQRRRALSPDSSFIVQAPAGSGKTELLTQRFLRLLAVVEKPEEILAMTFTRKAAGEMRNRILEALQDAREQKAVTEDYQVRRRQLAEEVLRRDEEMGWLLLEHPARLRLTTIDGFNAAIARRIPLLAGPDLSLSVADDPDALYLLAARRQMGAAGQDAKSPEARLLAHLDNRYASAVTLLANMLRARVHWLRRIMPMGAASGLREGLESALERQVYRQVGRLRQAFTAASRKTLAELIVVALHNSPGMADDFGCSEERIGDAETLEFWQFAALLLLTKSGPQWRKKVSKATGFPTGEARKANMEDFLEALRDDDELAIQLDEIRLLPRKAYPDEQWKVLESLLTVLPECAAQLKLVFAERGEVDYAEVAIAALNSLGEPERPTDLALFLDYRIRHILVDEFQDTSFEQVQMLKLLTAGWQPGDGRTLFLVGDPMQSIYRFREAEVALFMECARNGLDGGRIPLEAVVLSTNFRSQQGLVEWFNEAFGKIMPQVEDLAEAKVRFSASVADKRALAGDAVSVHPSLGNDEDAEAATVARLVSAALDKDADGNVAILVRSRAHLRRILPALRQAGLAFRTVDTESLAGRPVIQDLLALTRAILHPADRGAWLAVLRAPWCGLSLADLYVLMGADHRMTVAESMESIDPDELSADGKVRLRRVRGPLLQSLAEQGRHRLRARVENLWVALGGPAVLGDAADIENADSYFRLLEKHDLSGEPADLSGIEEKLGGLYAAPDPEADGRLQIMTIHKSKGLEFDTVIIPGIGKQPADTNRPLLRWLSVVAEQGGEEELLMAPLSATGDDSDPFFKLLKRLDDQRNLYETDRLLYVACTRAKKRLHLLGHATVSAKNPQARAAGKSLLQRMWPVLKDVYDELPREPAAVSDGVPRPAQLPLIRLPADWQLPVLPVVETVSTLPEDSGESAVAIEFDWAKEAVRMIGLVVHAELDLIGREGMEKWSRARVGEKKLHYRAQLMALGLPATDLDDATESVQESIGNILDDEKGRWILGAHLEASCEQALSGFLGGELVNVVLDRTFIDEEGTRWIIDYKTSRHEGGDLDDFLDMQQQRYEGQLERYARLMHNMEDRPVRVGLYFPLLKGWREWQPDL
ncbi:MAG: UvrD-helicase domain-containing protein [Gammaproteobacteria bacterium]|nr:UvrD-helicase domain-containing protein [Gammaproteobacteria bacterium]